MSMAAQFTIKRNDGVESGPFTREQLRAMLDSGELSAGTPTRSERWKWWWTPSDMGWFPLQVLLGPIHLRDIRVPRSTLVWWTLIAAGLFALVALRILMK